MMSRLLVLALAGCCLVTGCSRRVTYLPAVSTKEIDTAGVNLSRLPSKDVDSGVDRHFLGLGAKVCKAVDRALTENDANLLVDAVVYRDYFFPFYGYRVTGRAYSVPVDPTR